MKKTKNGMIALLLTLVLLLTAAPTVFALDGYYMEDGYTYMIRDGFAQIVEFPETADGDVFIPARYKGLPVTVSGSLCGSGDHKKLTRYTVAEDSETLWADDNGILYSKDKTELVSYPRDLVLDVYELPATATSIGPYAFEGNSTATGRLGRLVIPANVTRISPDPFFSFYLYNTVAEIEVSEDHPVFSSLDGVLYNKDKTELIAFPRLREYDVFVVPASVQTIRYHSGTCLKMNELRFEKGSRLTSFHYGMFSFSRIGKVVLPAGLTLDDVSYGDALIDELTFAAEGAELDSPADPDLELEADVVRPGSASYLLAEQAIAESASPDYTVLSVFDLTLKNKDGVHVQPNGTVQVKLPLDWEKGRTYKVYRVNDDGTLTDMNARRQGSHMVFETDHFSLYAITDAGQEGQGEQNGRTEPLDFIRRLISALKALWNRILSFFGVGR